MSESWTYTAENTYAALGDRPSLTTTLGVVYTPSERWRLDGSLLVGETVEEDGTRVERRALSLGARFADGEAMRAGLRGEVRRESSGRAEGLDADTVVALAFLDRRVSDDWRLLLNLDAVLSEDDEASVRDGRFVEARLGWAYRPVETGITALLSYTFLDDLPGPDQANLDGETDGPLQRSHILNAALSRALGHRWTLGAKYGLRLREEAPRADEDAVVTSTAHLGILRLDYHVMRNWDLMGEVHALHAVEAGTTDRGALLGALPPPRPHPPAGRRLRLRRGVERPATRRGRARACSSTSSRPSDASGRGSHATAGAEERRSRPWWRLSPPRAPASPSRSAPWTGSRGWRPRLWPGPRSLWCRPGGGTRRVRGGGRALRA